MADSFIIEVRDAADKRLLFLPHALDVMNVPEELITPEEVRDALFKGEIIENYPEDTRGHSCLILGYNLQRRPIQVVCAPKGEYLAIITVYLPDTRRWMDDFKHRR